MGPSGWPEVNKATWKKVTSIIRHRDFFDGYVRSAKVGRDVMDVVCAWDPGLRQLAACGRPPAPRDLQQ